MQLTQGFKRILSNTGFLFFEKVINLFLGLVVGIYVARYLGPSDYGLYQYAQSFIALFMAFATMGTNSIVIRDLVNIPDKENEILGTSFGLMLAGGGVTFIIVVVLGIGLNDDFISRLLVCIIAITLVLQSFQIFDYWFQAQVLSKYSVYSRTTAQIISSIVKLFLIFLSASVLYFALAMILIWIIQICLWIYYFKSLDKKIGNWIFEKTYANDLFKNVWPLILSGISVAVYMKIDQVMIKNMLDTDAVGKYAVAARISELWYFIPVSISSSVFPSIIMAKKDSIEKYHKRLQHLYDVLCGIAILIALPLTFLSNFIIDLLFGPNYMGAGPVLTIHIWSGVFVFLGVARSRWIINENYQKYGMIFTISGAIVNVIMNLILIPEWGIIGAAWATVISYLLSSWVMALFFKQTRISFYMLGQAFLNTVLIVPVFRTVNEIYKEAKE